MKRSEMTKLIEDFLDVHKEMNNKMLSLWILSLVEEYGMLPPAYMKPVEFESDGKQYPLVPGDFQNEQGIWCTPGHWGWESEE